MAGAEHQCAASHHAHTDAGAAWLGRDRVIFNGGPPNDDGRFRNLAASLNARGVNDILRYFKRIITLQGPVSETEQVVRAGTK